MAELHKEVRCDSSVQGPSFDILALQDIAHFYRASQIELQIEKVGVMKSNYGALEVQRFPLHKAARLFVVPPEGANIGTVRAPSQVAGAAHGCTRRFAMRRLTRW